MAMPAMVVRPGGPSPSSSTKASSYDGNECAVQRASAHDMMVCGGIRPACNIPWFNGAQAHRLAENPCGGGAS